MIAKRNKGLNSSFIVRKISNGEGVERTFQMYSPLIASIELKAPWCCARAKLTTCVIVRANRPRIREKLETSKTGCRVIPPAPLSRRIFASQRDGPSGAVFW